MDPIMLEGVYAREVMRCLGFLPDELFFGIHNPEGVILRTQNKSSAEDNHYQRSSRQGLPSQSKSLVT